MSLLVVGALHWDVVVQADRMPRLDETLRGEHVDYRFGGKGGNQAVAAARAGASVAFAGRIGSDDAGHAMRDVLIAAGVDVGQLQQGPGASGMSVAIGVAGGGYGAVIVSGENLAMDAAAIEIPRDCRIVLMQNEVANGLLLDVAAKAESIGAQVWLNAAPAEGLGHVELAMVDMLIVNRVEGADLAGAPPGDLTGVETVSALQSLAPKASVVLTLGGDGVVYAAPGGAIVSAPARSVGVVSTHGAGDAFVGAFAAAILRGQAFPEAIDAAQSAAAALITQSR